METLKKEVVSLYFLIQNFSNFQTFLSFSKMVMVNASNSNDENMIHGVLDNSFDLQEGDQVFFLAPGEQIEMVPIDNDDDSDDDSV